MLLSLMLLMYVQIDVMKCHYHFTADTWLMDCFLLFFLSAAAYSPYFYLFRDPQPQCFYPGTFTSSTANSVTSI